MDVRIGVINTPRELVVVVGEEADRAAIKEASEQALSGTIPVLWVTDRKGREVGVPAEKLAYVEIGSAGDTPDIGFGTA